MGEIETKTLVRSNGKQKQLCLTWDNGSPWTFISESNAFKIGKPWELGEPKKFRGLGHGGFEAHYAMHLHFKLKGIWCSYLVYVVPDDALADMDILIGHEFMEVYRIRLDPRQKRIHASKKGLLHASFVY